MTLARQAAQLRHSAPHWTRRAAIPDLWLLSDATRLPDPRAAILRLAPGSGFIFRHYELRDRESMARQLQRLCKQRRIVFLLAGDWRMAVRLRADGMHLPEHMAHQAHAIRGIMPHALVTAAAHHARAAHGAARHGADAIMLSPVFATQSHPGGKVLGPVRFAHIAHRQRTPVIALGGVNKHTARRLKGSGAAGVAAISGLG